METPEVGKPIIQWDSEEVSYLSIGRARYIAGLLRQLTAEHGIIDPADIPADSTDNQAIGLPGSSEL